MDIFIPIIICVIFFILFSFCGYCCKRKREGTVYGPAGTNVTITTQPISASPVVVPPYPVEPRHPTPHMGPPTPGFAPHHMPYPPQGAAPYPAHAPYPPVPGPMGGTAPYPEYSAHPPSYAEAVSQPPVQPPGPTKEVYSKQAPYNPHY